MGHRISKHQQRTPAAITTSSAQSSAAAAAAGLEDVSTSCARIASTSATSAASTAASTTAPPFATKVKQHKRKKGAVAKQQRKQQTHASPPARTAHVALPSPFSIQTASGSDRLLRISNSVVRTAIPAIESSLINNNIEKEHSSTPSIRTAALVHQQQFESLTSTGNSVVITIRMLKMESNELNNLVQQHQQHENRISESSIVNSKCTNNNFLNNNNLNTVNHSGSASSSANNNYNNQSNSNDNHSRTMNGDSMSISSTSTATTTPSTSALSEFGKIGEHSMAAGGMPRDDDSCTGQINNNNSHSPDPTTINRHSNENALSPIETSKFVVAAPSAATSANSANNNAFAMAANSDKNSVQIVVGGSHLRIIEDANEPNAQAGSKQQPQPQHNFICDSSINGKQDSAPSTTVLDWSLVQPTSSMAMINAMTTKLNQANITATPSAALIDGIPAEIINSVSPYPHHIPIGSIHHHDCTIECAANCVQCQQKKLRQSSSSVAHSAKCCNKCPFAKEPINKESKAKRPNWSLKFNCPKLKSIKSLSTSSTSVTAASAASTASAATVATATPTTSAISNKPLFDMTSTMQGCCVAATANDAIVAISTPVASTTTTSTAVVLENGTLYGPNGGNVILVTMDQGPPLLDFSRFNPDDFPIEDCDKKARLQRALEIAEGVEPPPGFMSSSSHHPSATVQPLSTAVTLPSVGGESVASTMPEAINVTAVEQQHWHMVCSNNAALRFMLPNLLQHPDDIPRIHSQVDYIHCLVPDLKKITSCSFYWGKMDRYEAERLLEGKPEGTFLLRDSAQEEFLFSVSFRKYGRSLHARIEQFNHKFSFDCHDPGVYTSSTVTGLLEHYKDPACVMFFEPALTLPLNRNFAFSLQQLCRATIVSHTTYDGINDLCLPKKLKSYLKEYHYKQRVRVKRLDETYYNNPT